MKPIRSGTKNWEHGRRGGWCSGDRRKDRGL